MKDKNGFIHDEFECLGQLQEPNSEIEVEGGDSANWMGHFVYLTEGEGTIGDRLWDGYLYSMFFKKKEGAYCRHPIPSNTYYGFGSYYKNPWSGCISRDQLTGIIGGLLKTGQTVELIKLILHHACWLFLFSYNTRTNGTKKADWKWPDFTGPDIWAMELRGFGALSLVLLPIINIFDIQLMIQSIFYPKDDKSPDPISFLMKFFVSQDFVRTPASIISRKVLDHEVLLREVKHYWDGPFKRQPAMVDLYEYKIYEIFTERNPLIETGIFIGGFIYCCYVYYYAYLWAFGG